MKMKTPKGLNTFIEGLAKMVAMRGAPKTKSDHHRYLQDPIDHHDKETDFPFKYYSKDPFFFARFYPQLTENDYNRFVTRRSASRDIPNIREIATLSYKVNENMISLAEGMPNEEVFPFSHLRLKLKSGSEMTMSGKELAKALQYVPSQGHPDLLSSLREFQTMIHRPPELARELIISNGAQHGIYQCCELLVEPNDPVLVAEYAYSGFHVALRPYDPEIVAIPEDDHGIMPDALQAILAARLSFGMKMPKVLYCIPTGNNPTGTVLPEDRKRAIYELACIFDFLIIEDDPYMFLNYNDEPIPSFLSMDSCGRVIRLDSFSKVVSAGLRTGWVTAPTTLARRLELHSQAEILHSCSLGQAILHKLLKDRKALEKHLVSTRNFYKHRRDRLDTALRSAKLNEVSEWNVPDAGLFLWMKVKGVDDVYNMAFRSAFEKGLMLIPGHAFLYNTHAPSQHLRLTFSKVPIEDMDAAACTLAEIIVNEQNASTSKKLHSFATDR